MVQLAALVNANCSQYSPALFENVAETVKGINGKGSGQLELCRLTYDFHSLNRDVEELARLEPEYLLVGGGDGSFLFYLKKLKEVYGDGPLPRIVYLPIGRENRLGHELGNYRRPMRFLEEVVEGIRRNELAEERMSLIEARLDEGREMPTFDFGFGLATSLLLHYYGIQPQQIREGDHFRNMARPRRRTDALRTFLAALFNSFWYWTSGAKEYFGGARVEIKVEEENLGKKYWLGGFASTNRYVWRGFKPMYKGRADPEKMHLVATSQPPVMLALKLWTLYHGGPIGGNTLDETAKRAELVFDRPTIIQMAGEFFVAEKVELKVKKNGICFVKPRRKQR